VSRLMYLTYSSLSSHSNMCRSGRSRDRRRPRRTWDRPGQTLDRGASGPGRTPNASCRAHGTMPRDHPHWYFIPEDDEIPPSSHPLRPKARVVSYFSSSSAGVATTRVEVAIIRQSWHQHSGQGWVVAASDTTTEGRRYSTKDPEKI
jgi:hypothetical protein